MATTVRHNPARRRFEIFLGDTLAGYAEYAERPGVRDFNHTFTYPQHRGHGLAAEVVRFALDDSRAEGVKIVPTCWFVDEFVAGHRDYRDLVA